jgi:anti-anti-sigma factor
MGSEPEPDAFRVETVRLGHTTLVVVHGELDLATAPQLRDATATASRDIERLIIDLSQATFIDSVGICTLIEASRRSADRGTALVVITTSGSPVDRTLTIVDADSVLPIIHERQGSASPPGAI